MPFFRTWPFALAIPLLLTTACSQDREVGNQIGDTSVSSASGAGGASTSSSAGSGGFLVGSSSGSGGGGLGYWGCETVGPGPLQRISRGADGRWVAVHGTNAYWVDQGITGEDGTPTYVIRVPLDCSEGEVWGPFNADVGGLVADATGAYAALNGDIVKLAPGNLVVLAAGPSIGQVSVEGLAVDGEFLYWAAPFDGFVAKMPVSGGPVIKLAEGENQPARVVRGGDDVYWIDRTAGTIRRVSKAGGTAADAGPGAGGDPGAQLAGSADAVYWPDIIVGDSYQIKKLAVGASVPEVLADAGGVPNFITVDATHVYWTDTSEKNVSRIPLQGGSREVLAGEITSPQGIAVDATHVYWVEIHDKALYRLPK